MRKILYWWPEDGWQRGRLCQGGAFSHVVAYTRQASALRGMADTLLDAALPPTASVGRCSPQPLVSGPLGPLTRRLRPAALAGPPRP